MKNIVQSRLRGPYFLLLIALLSAVSGFLSGFDTCIIAGALPLLAKHFALSDLQQEWLVSCIILGAFIGSVVCGTLADRFGRLPILRYVALLFIIGSIITITGETLTKIVIGRFLQGIAIGISAFTTPLYISELSPSEQRGRFVLIYSVAISLGQVSAYAVNYTLMNQIDAWHQMFGVSLLPALLLCFGLVLLPESPPWLARQKQFALAKSVLEQIRGTRAVQAEFNLMLNSQQPLLWRSLFDKKMRSVLCLGIALGVLQQCAGINMILYYGGVLLTEVGFVNPRTAIGATLFIAFISVLVNILVLIRIDQIGRRPMFIIGTLIAGFALFILAKSQHSPWFNFFAIASYISGFVMSLGALFWLIISEIYPLAIRGFAMSVVCALQWLANFLVSITYLSMLHGIGSHHSFLLFAFVNVGAAVLAYYFLPETKGVPLETIEANLNQGLGLRHLGKTGIS